MRFCGNTFWFRDKICPGSCAQGRRRSNQVTDNSRFFWCPRMWRVRASWSDAKAVLCFCTVILCIKEKGFICTVEKNTKYLYRYMGIVFAVQSKMKRRGKHFFVTVFFAKILFIHTEDTVQTVLSTVQQNPDPAFRGCRCRVFYSTTDASIPWEQTKLLLAPSYLFMDAY